MASSLENLKGKTSAFRILQLPKAPVVRGTASHEQCNREFIASVERYKEFRLFSLSSAPNAFATTYEEAANWSWDAWMQRVQNQDIIQFIAIPPTSTEPEERALMQSKWIGMIALARNQGTLLDGKPALLPRPLRNGGNIAEQVEKAYHAPLSYKVIGLFIIPSFRSKGLGGLLLEKCFECIRHELHSSEYDQGKIETLVDTWNEKALSLYKSMGFETIGSDDYIVGGFKREAALMVRLIGETQ